MRMAMIGSLFLVSGTACAQSVFDLGRLPGGTWTYTSNLSTDGNVVCGDANIPSGAARAWRWTAAAGVTNLGVPAGADHSYGYGMSGDGLVVVGAAGNQAYDMACRWTQATGMQSLGSIAAGQPSFASDASFDGSIVFGYGYLANGEETAFKWTPSTGMRAFGQRLAGTNQSVGLAVNGAGTAYVGYCFNNAPALIYPTACKWNAAGVVTDLGLVPGTQMSVPSDVNADGSVVVGYAADAAGQNLRPFKWTLGTGMQDLGLPAGASQAVATSVSGDGSIITGYAIVGPSASACVWVGSSGPQLLDAYLQSQGISTAGWTFEGCSVSSDASAMAGNGHHSGVASAWHARLAGCTMAPTITEQPVSQTVMEGAAASFTVVATGPGISYQWYKGPAMLINATGSVYSITTAAVTDAGDYSCTLTNSCGSLSSTVAMLTVQSNCPVPTITSQPQDALVARGQSVSFEVAASSNTEEHYQWRQDGNDLDGQIDARIDIEHVTEAEVGRYDCVVTNACGSVTSDLAILALCAADFNGDGFLDFFDYDEYVNCFETGSCSGDRTADFNADGFLDFFDYDDFVTAFETGC